MVAARRMLRENYRNPSQLQSGKPKAESSRQQQQEAAGSSRAAGDPEPPLARQRVEGRVAAVEAAAVGMAEEFFVSPRQRSWPAEVAWRFREIEPRPRHLRSIPNDGEAFGQLKEYGGQPCVAVGDGLDGKEGPTALDGLDVKIPCRSRFVLW